MIKDDTTGVVGQSSLRSHCLDGFVGGWLVGHFEPALFFSQDVEVAVKNYRAGEMEQRHHHKIATEYTVIAKGKVRMNGQEYVSGQIVQVDPGQATDFHAIEDTITLVIKTPSVANDKYLGPMDRRGAA